MQQNQAQQQKQQGQGAQPAVYKPHEHTVFLIQRDDEFEKRARAHIDRTYGRGGGLKGRVVTQLNTQRLRPETEIVVVYCDPEADVVDADGSPRARDFQGERRDGKVVRKHELPAVIESKPVGCADLWLDAAADDEASEMAIGGVRLNNVVDEHSGRERLGLIGHLTAACFGKTSRGRDRAVVRVVHRPDIHEITVRAA